MKKANLYWFLLAGAAVGLAFLAAAPYAAYTLYAFLLLVLLANISSRVWLTGLVLERTVSETILRQGEETLVEVTLTNRRGFPIPWVFVEDFIPAGFPVIGDTSRLAVLMPGRAATLQYRLRCPRRGYHRIGPLLLETGDLFGLQKRFKTGGQQDYISVLPTVAYIDTFTISARRPQGPVRISNRVYEDPTRIAGLREYVPGDPLNRVHWKVSARTGDLFVKQNEPSNVLGATLVLDLFHVWYQGEKGESRMELAITTAASIAYLLQMSGEQVGMVTNARDAAEVAKYEVAAKQSLSRQEADAGVAGEDESGLISPLEVPTRRSPIQAMKIVENLARVLPGEALDAGQLVQNTYRRLPRDAALVLVVPKVPDDLVSTLAAMKLSGFAVTVFLIDNNADYLDAASKLAAENIYTFHIEHERDLHEIKPQHIGR